MRVIGLVKLMEEKEKASLKDEGIACLWEYVEILQNELRGARKKPIKVFLRYLKYKLFTFAIVFNRVLPLLWLVRISTLANKYRPDSEWTATPATEFVKARSILGHRNRRLSEKALQRGISIPNPSMFPDLSSLHDFVPSGRIAVFLHLYYKDMWDELSNDLNNIPEQFDLFVSLVRGKSDEIEGRIRNTFPHAVVHIFPNHGRDIYPFVSFLNTGLATKYDLILKVHSKLAPHLDGGAAWRRSFLNPLVGSKGRIREFLWAFQTDPKLGLLAPCGHLSGKWGVCLPKVAALAAQVRIRLRPGKLRFAVGSMFWIRAEALKKIVELDLKADDFEAEANQIDGCMHHAVERFIGVVTRAAGLGVQEVGEALDRAPEPRDLSPLQAT